MTILWWKKSCKLPKNIFDLSNTNFPYFFCQYRTEDLDKSEPSPSSTKKPGFFSSLLFGSSWQIQSYEKYSRTCASKWGPPNLVFVATFKEFSSKKTNVFLLKVGIISDGNFNFVLSWKIYETNHHSTFQHKVKSRGTMIWSLK